MAKCRGLRRAGRQQQKRCTAAGRFRDRDQRRLFQAQSFDALCGVELGEEYDDSDGPALYIYYARQGERIFDIARRYHARARDLAAANHLDTNGDPPQELTTDTACLLIPAAL